MARPIATSFQGFLANVAMIITPARIRVIGPETKHADAAFPLVRVV